MSIYLKYLRYVIRHKWFVFVECCKVGMPWRGLVHDLSKFRLSEFVPYARYFYGDYPEWARMQSGRKETYFGLTKESVADAFDKAWLLHQHRNPHHWQFWVLQNDNDGRYPLRMPWVYVFEMVCDWKGCGRALGKPDTLAWYVQNRDDMVLNIYTRDHVERLLSVPQSIRMMEAMGQ